MAAPASGRDDGPAVERGARLNTPIRREMLALGIAAAVGGAALWRWPFPADNILLQLVRLERPSVFMALRWSYLAMMFTTPYIVCTVVRSAG